MKQKGFTLVELLAVLVVLGLILTITFPIITGVQKRMAEKSGVTNTQNIIRAAELYYTKSLKGINTFDGTKNVINEIQYTGKRPVKGEVYIDVHGKVAVALVFRSWCYSRSFTDQEIQVSKDTDTCTLGIHSEAS